MPGRGAPPPAGRVTIRLDKWLWQARLFKSRSLAARAVEAGEVRLNSVRCRKPSHAVGAGDALTLVQGGRVRVLRILAAGHRRGPAPEAQSLYEDLAAPAAEAGPDRRTQAVVPSPPLD